MGTLLLIRHGETLWNQQARYQGQMNIELSDRGCEQAEAIANRLSNVPIHAIYTSDLDRARQTADRVGTFHSAKTIVDPRLRETHFGEWEGLTRDEIRNKYPEAFSQRYSIEGQMQIPGAEAAASVQKRMLAALQEIALRHQGETAAVISHGGAMRLVFTHLLGLDIAEAYRIRMYNTSISELETDPCADSSDEFRAKVVRINDISHLRHDGVISH